MQIYNSRWAARLRCRKARFLWWLAALFALAPAAFAQYQVDNWTLENGLPQQVVRDVCQMPDGYLWLATMGGLVRFDGVHFTVFDRSNTPGILGNRFNSLYCSDTGEFWAGTETNGVTRYRQGRFVTYTRQQGLPSNVVQQVTGDKHGGIWALSNGAILQWNEGQSKFVPVPPHSETPFLPDGSFGFVSVDQEGVHLFSRGKETDYPLPHGWPLNGVVRVGQDLNGIVWLASADGRFAKLRNGHWTPIFRPDAKQTGTNALTSSYRDSRGDVFQIGIHAGAGASFISYLSLPSHGQTQRIVFNSFFEDREGNVWLPTDGQGLFRIRHALITSFSKEEGLPDRNIYPIFQDHAGAIWIGTWNGGLVRFSDGTLKVFTTADGLSSNRVNSIGEDRDGALWVSTSPGMQTIRDGKVERVKTGNLQLPDDVRAIHQDENGAMFLGTSRGLFRYKDEKWSVLTTKDGLASDDVRVMIDGRAGNLWMAGYGGLTSLSHGKFKRWTEDDGLPSNSIRSLYEDRDSTLWIGTYDGGLARLAEGHLTRFTTSDGLFDSGVFQILEDSRGYLWMSCNRGIYRVAKADLDAFARGAARTISSVAYGKSDGMRNPECNGGESPAGIKTRRGELWFPTLDGVAIINPDHVAVNTTPPTVVIESAAVNREPVNLNDAVRIQPGRENLEISYTAPSLTNSSQIKFKYKLENLDHDWVEAGGRRTAYYSHLPPGNYTFRVIAANSDGVWNTNGRSLAVTVLPRIDQTWWFRTAVIALVLGAICFGWFQHISTLKQQQATQRAFSRQLIASQEAERKRIAAELHDSLGQGLAIIRNRAMISLSTPSDHKRAFAQLHEISNASAEIIEEMKEIAHNLRPYQLDRLGLTRAIESMIRNTKDSHDLTFKVDIDSIDSIFSSDVEINIFRIIQEGMNNIVKHSHATEAMITIKRTPQQVRITIGDNGVGFVPREGDGVGRHGFGQIGMEERASLIGGKYTLHSASGLGTVVTLVIALKDDSHAGTA
ncbi:ligand-binding sensor domain-containing protein [Terracidiphilus gabretensis]|uniref:ligand-binding sensor domain-containing protein n=1 Tax=Terracidiphilus gabretensis TaxID=1577687 RepID=UPI00071BFC79|nr:sensor histidine kinase [Terracidiphilus gabretensis]